MFLSWLSGVFSHPDLMGALIIAAKSAVVYLFVIVGLRLLGTRELGQLTTYDLVLIVVLSNSVQNALVGGDTTLVGGLVSALTLLIVNRLLTAVRNRFPGIDRAMVGEPIVLLTDGHLHWDRMRREGVTRDELMAGLREHGIERPDDVRLAVLEVDGAISVVPKDATVHRTQRHVRGLKVS